MRGAPAACVHLGAKAVVARAKPSLTLALAGLALFRLRSASRAKELAHRRPAPPHGPWCGPRACLVVRVRVGIGEVGGEVELG